MFHSSPEPCDEHVVEGSAATVPVDYSDQIQVASCERNAGDVCAPHMIRRIDLDTAQQVRIAHGRTVEVQSELATGTTVTVTLPIEQVRESPELNGGRAGVLPFELSETAAQCRDSCFCDLI